MTPAADSHRSDPTLDERASDLLARAEQIAVGPLEGIDDAARELAQSTGGDLRVLERARRAALSAARDAPSPGARQTVSLLRRALEVGAWDWGP